MPEAYPELGQLKTPRHCLCLLEVGWPWLRTQIWSNSPRTRGQRGVGAGSARGGGSSIWKVCVSWLQSLDEGSRTPGLGCPLLGTWQALPSSPHAVFGPGGLEAGGSQLFALGQGGGDEPCASVLTFFYSSSLSFLVLPPSPPGGGSSWASGTHTHPWVTSWAP